MAMPPNLLRSAASLFLAPPSYFHSNSQIDALPSTILHFPQRPSRRQRLAQYASAVADYRDHRRYGAEAAAAAAAEEGARYPRPPEVPWKKELCNLVHLIGLVGAPVEIKHLPNGKVLAWTRLAVKKSATDTSWISLTFWDELAQVAFQHVEKGNQIYISGRLVSDTVESDDGKPQTYYKVVVQQFNFVERSSLIGAASDRPAARKFGVGAGNEMVSVEESWQAFFANPLEWWDNRKTKRNPKYPDFKHKDTGEALWIEGRNNPPWVKSQLAKLDEKMGSLQNLDAQWPVRLMSADELTPF